MSSMSTFSERHGYQPPEAEITIRHEAPDELRAVVIDIAYECGLDPSDLRASICRLLRKRPDPNNWSEYPNIDSEVHCLMQDCEWYEVYDVIETIAASLARKILRDGSPAQGHFVAELDRYFRRRGIGWQLVDGMIETRGPEGFELALKDASTALLDSGRTTAANEIHQALVGLSRRPQPDITGAIQHALAALECTARDVCGDPKSTLGALLKANPGLVSPPLDGALEKLWGFASEQGRHLREGRLPAYEDAELAVHTAAAVCRYLARKQTV